MKENNPFEDAPVVFSYSRAQAIEDGVLVDLTEWGSETGFKIPVACTAQVWNQFLTPPPKTRELGQSERGRAHDVLWLLFVAIQKRSSSRRAKGNGELGSTDQLLYEVNFLQSPESHETVTPGDQGEPVLSILMPDED